MKCLEKDRSRRYESVSGLAADIQRFLVDEPVEAGPPSAAYRIRKFVRRHRVAIGISALLAAAVAVALGSVAGVVHDRRWHRRVLELQVNAALQETVASYERGQLLEAISAVKRAESLLAGQRDSDPHDLVRNWRKDLDMVARLEQIRLETSETKHDEIDHDAADMRFAEAFHDYGVDVDKLGPDVAGQRLSHRPVSRELAAGLDDWADHRRLSRGMLIHSGRSC